MSERKYDAFISYRHLPHDKAVAKKLQTLLEHIRPPRGLECKNTTRITRIFRDESELPTSGDLGHDLISALENSSYLIVLCSPKLKESKWCLAEIEHFKKLHGWKINRILPVLVDGDPNESFPDILRYEDRIVLDEHGNEQIEKVEIEPLACNIASDGDIKKSLKKLKIEYLRIAAPILGCGFDDLYRRHRRRKIQRTVTAVSAASLLTLISSVVFTMQNRNVITHRDSMFVELSAAAYISGQIPDAISYAMQALQPRNRLMPGFLPSAQLALTNALGVYDLSDNYRPFEAFLLPSTALNTALSPDGKTSAIVRAFEVIVFDTAANEQIISFNTTRSAMAEAVFLDNDILLFAGENGLTAYSLSENRILWEGGRATGIAVSADRSRIAGIYLNESEATIYEPNGNIVKTVSFEGKAQRVVYHDLMANPNSNLFSLNHDGSWLAVSFQYSDLTLFSLTEPDLYIEIPDTYVFAGFNGGFHSRYFAFSAFRTGYFARAMVVDLEALEIVYFQELSNNFIVWADELGIFIANQDILLNIDPTYGNHQVAAVAEADIHAFALSDNSLIIANHENSIEIFDRNANRLVSYNLGHLSDFVAVNNGMAITASRNSDYIRLFERQDNSGAEAFTYNSRYQHTRTRINADRTRVMRYSPGSFRLYDNEGVLINETELPDPMRIFNQQLAPQSGNLIIIYNDALRIYCGNDGSLLFEADNLLSTFFAVYGVSILEQSGRLSLIDLDTAQESQAFQVQGNFAAYAGMIVDDAFLAGRELIGSARYDSGYYFAVSSGSLVTVYNNNGQRQFDIKIDTGHFSEAFFANDAVIVSPLHGTTAVYRLSNGRRIRLLEEEAFLTYVHQLDEYIVVEYITMHGDRFGVLKDAGFESLAYLHNLTDISNGSLLFDYQTGSVRESRVFSLEELKMMAKGR